MMMSSYNILLDPETGAVTDLVDREMAGLMMTRNGS